MDTSEAMGRRRDMVGNTESMEDGRLMRRDAKVVDELHGKA